MFEGTFIQAWARLVESLATIGIIVTALCLMLGIVERSEVIKHIGAILGIAVVLILIPAMLVNAWAALSLWQQIGVAAIGIVIWRFRRQRRQVRNHTQK
jgi:low temperature requirement protein LtrA